MPRDCKSMSGTTNLDNVHRMTGRYKANEEKRSDGFLFEEAGEVGTITPLFEPLAFVFLESTFSLAFPLLSLLLLFVDEPLVVELEFELERREDVRRSPLLLPLGDSRRAEDKPVSTVNEIFLADSELTSGGMKEDWSVRLR